MGVFPEQQSLVGRVIASKLELKKLLGSGSMGQVYKAHHTALNKPIAIKVMRPEMHPTAEQLTRFRNEAQSSSRLDHPNIVQILDFGEDGEDKLLYIAMEFLDGEELTGLLTRRGQFSESQACQIMTQVLAALAVAHDEGIVHRDIKPGNIMLIDKKSDDGIINEFVKVCDFGIAKLLVGEEGVAPLTMEGVSLGTPAYAAPEQILGQTIDGRADLYACGVILYTMLAGCRPFEADSPMAMAMKHIKQTPPDLLGIRAELTPELSQIVHKAMSKKAEERFADAREMRSALKPYTGLKTDTGAFLAQATPPAPAPSGPPPPNNQGTASAAVDLNTLAISIDETGVSDEFQAALKESENSAATPELDRESEDLIRAFLGEASEPPTPSAPPVAAASAPAPPPPAPALESPASVPTTPASSPASQTKLTAALIGLLLVSLGVILMVFMQWL